MRADRLEALYPSKELLTLSSGGNRRMPLMRHGPRMQMRQASAIGAAGVPMYDARGQASHRAGFRGAEPESGAIGKVVEAAT